MKKNGSDGRRNGEYPSLWGSEGLLTGDPVPYSMGMKFPGYESTDSKKEQGCRAILNLAIFARVRQRKLWPGDRDFESFPIRYDKRPRSTWLPQFFGWATRSEISAPAQRTGCFRIMGECPRDTASTSDSAESVGTSVCRCDTGRIDPQISVPGCFAGVSHTSS